MVLYPVTRFLVEYLRNDEKVFFLGMTVSQNISLFLFLAGLAYWFRLSRWPARTTGEPSDTLSAETAEALAS